LLAPTDWINPVPGLSGNYKVGLSARRVPPLEGSDLHADAIRFGDGGHPQIGFDTEHLAAFGHEQSGHPACSATNLKHSRWFARYKFVN
jgi:hypothetical protein